MNTTYAFLECEIVNLAVIVKFSMNAHVGPIYSLSVHHDLARSELDTLSLDLITNSLLQPFNVVIQTTLAEKCIKSVL